MVQRLARIGLGLVLRGHQVRQDAEAAQAAGQPLPERTLVDSLAVLASVRAEEAVKTGVKAAGQLTDAANERARELADDAEARVRELAAQAGDAARTVGDYTIATYRWARAGFKPAEGADQQQLPDTREEDVPNPGERE